VSTSPHALPPSLDKHFDVYLPGRAPLEWIATFRDRLFVGPLAACCLPFPAWGHRGRRQPLLFGFPRNCTVVTEDATPWSVQLFGIPSVGRSAVLTDPQGAVFSVLRPSQQP
jgi:hypothetical protein